MTEEVRVVRNDDRSRYEVLVDGVVAGFSTFEPDAARPGSLVFPHTVVDPAFGGRGLGTTLVAEAMSDLAARGEAVVPVCPFVVKYLDENEVPGLQVNRRDGAAAQ